MPRKPGLPPDDRRCTALRANGTQCGQWSKLDGPMCSSHEALLAVGHAAGPPPEDRRCTAVRLDGERCAAWAKVDSTLCLKHGAVAPPDDRRCTGIASGGTTRPERKGERCLAWALPGLNVCRSHGGSAKAAEVGRRRVVEAQLLEKATNLVGSPVDNPLTELAALAGRARAWMEILETKVHDLGDDIRYEGKVGEQLRAEVALYERAMDRCGRFLTDYGRLGIDDRLAKITEAQAERVIAAIDAALAHVGITGTAAVEAKQVAARRLRAV